MSGTAGACEQGKRSVATDDETLAQRMAQGDTVAFDLLLCRYETRLYNFILRMLHDPQESRDAFQDTFLRLFQHANRFDPSRRFSTWLYTIAANVCRDRLRGRRPDVSLDAPVDAVHENLTLGQTLAVADKSPADCAATNELEDRIRHAINQLPPLQREVLVLREYEQRSFEEIAEILGCKVGTAKSRLFYALKALRVLLAPLADQGAER